jgi:predicted TIM-barrel fold metal-dependent hydrolase
VTVDSHVHLFPARLQAAVRGFFFEQLGYEAWVYPTDHDQVCARLAADGIEEAWTLPYAHKPGVADGLNDAMAAVAAQQADGPVRIVPGATTHPDDADAVAPVRRAVEEHGARVLKLHCSVGGYEPDDPRLDPVWAYASEIRLPAVVHAGHAISGHTATDELAPLGRVAERWPEARLIIAHCGHQAVGEAITLAARHAAVHVDLTPVVSEPVGAAREDLLRLPGKVLFGSDAPNTFVPAADGLGRLRAMDLPADIEAAIRGGTARRLVAEVRT